VDQFRPGGVRNERHHEHQLNTWLLILSYVWIAIVLGTVVYVVKQ
jgi:hypothetical protein